MRAKGRAKTSKHVSINSSQRACIKNRVVGTDTYEQAMMHQVN